MGEQYNNHRVRHVLCVQWRRAVMRCRTLDVHEDSLTNQFYFQLLESLSAFSQSWALSYTTSVLTYRILMLFLRHLRLILIILLLWRTQRDLLLSQILRRPSRLVFHGETWVIYNDLAQELSTASLTVSCYIPRWVTLSWNPSVIISQDYHFSYLM